MIARMVGRDLSEMFPRVPHEPGEVILDLSGLAGRTLPRRADLALRRGEVFGIAGLVGAGRTELLRSIFGLDAVRSGTLRVRGLDLSSTSPRWCIAKGLGLLSEDRKGEGLALSRAIEDNLTYSALGRYARLGVLDLEARRAEASRWMKTLGVRARGPSQPVGMLSGGNQQKVASPGCSTSRRMSFCWTSRRAGSTSARRRKSTDSSANSPRRAGRSLWSPPTCPNSWASATASP